MKKMCCRNGSRLPSPLLSTRIPKHLHDSTPTQLRGSLGIVAALCRCTLSQPPTPHGRFVENKGGTPIRKACRKAVEALFYVISSPLLGVLPLALCGSRFSKIFVSLAP